MSNLMEQRLVVILTDCAIRNSLVCGSNNLALYSLLYCDAFEEHVYCYVLGVVWL